MQEIKKHIHVSKTGYNLCRLLDDRNISVKDIANSLNISQVAVYKWLSGTSLPTLEHFFQISQILNIPIDEIIVVA